MREGPVDADMTFNMPDNTSVLVKLRDNSSPEKNLKAILLVLNHFPQEMALRLKVKSLIEQVEPVVLTQEVARLGNQLVTGVWVLFNLISRFPADADMQDIVLSAIRRASPMAWEIAVIPGGIQNIDTHFSALITDFLDSVFDKKQSLKSPVTPLGLLFSLLYQDPDNLILHQLFDIAKGAIGSQCLGKIITVEHVGVSATARQSILGHLIDILNRAFESKQALRVDFTAAIYTLMLDYFRSMDDHIFEPVDELGLAFKTIGLLLHYMDDEEFFALAKIVIHKVSIYDLADVRLCLAKGKEDPTFDAQKVDELLALTESTISKYLEGLAALEDLTMEHHLKGSMCYAFTLFSRYPQNNTTQRAVSRLLDVVTLPMLIETFMTGRLKKKIPLIILIDVMRKFSADITFQKMSLSIIDRISPNVWATIVSLGRDHVLDDFFAVFLLGFLHAAHEDFTEVNPNSQYIN